MYNLLINILQINNIMVNVMYIRIIIYTCTGRLSAQLGYSIWSYAVRITQKPHFSSHMQYCIYIIIYTCCGHTMFLVAQSDQELRCWHNPNATFLQLHGILIIIYVQYFIFFIWAYTVRWQNIHPARKLGSFTWTRGVWLIDNNI